MSNNDWLFSMLSAHELRQYEIAVIANLQPQEVAEAKTLLPSLKRFDDDQIQAILNELQNFQRIVSDTRQPTIRKTQSDMDE